MLIFDDQHAERMRCAAEEVRARGAQVYVITDKPSLGELLHKWLTFTSTYWLCVNIAKGLDDEPIVIPSNGILTPLIGVLPLQVLII
jgi:glucosamine--fructose-6-phosphate aminotransferase (isomerizing)